MFEIYLKGELVQADLNYDEGKLTYLFVVNGVGKTTTIGKLAKKFYLMKVKVLLQVIHLEQEQSSS